MWEKTREDGKRALKSNAVHTIFPIPKPPKQRKAISPRNPKAATSVKLVSARWANIRDTWQKAMKKKKDEEVSGPSGKKCRDYVYQEQLMFLKKNQDTRPTQECSTKKRARTETEPINECDASEISEIRVPPTKERRKNYKDIDEKVAEFLETRMNTEKENHHLSFIKGVLPALNTFTVDETLEFQSSILRLIQNIKRKQNYIQGLHDPLHTKNNQWEDNQHSIQYTHQNGVIQQQSIVLIPSSSQPQVTTSPTTSTSVQSVKSPDSDYLDFEEMDSKHSIKILDE